VDYVYCPFDGARLKVLIPGVGGALTVEAARPFFRAMLAGTGTVPVSCPSCGRPYELGQGGALGLA
jgi:hypothetical protein